MNQGMRFALRSLTRTPSFTAIAILTLAIGIGTNTAIFAIVDELLFRPERDTPPEGVYGLGEVQIPDYETLAANPPAGVSAIAAYDWSVGLLQIPGRAERVEGRRVTGGYGPVTGVRAQVGRWISDDDNVGGVVDPLITRSGITQASVFGQLGMDVVVISDRIWREWFNASPDIVEGTVTLDHKPTRVIGVAPRGFGIGADIWTPFGRRRLLTREELEKQRRPGWKGRPSEPQQPRMMVLLRKDPDASTTVIYNRLNAIVAARPARADMPTRTFSEPRSRPRPGDNRLLTTGHTILGFAALIFVAACANLGNMLFARATEREGELAVRLSLGATRFGVFRLLLSETIAICAAASVVGLLFAAAVLYWFADAFPTFKMSSWRQVTLDLSIDWRIASYAAGAGLAAALIVGAGSLWRSSRVSLLARLAACGPAVAANTEGRTIRTMLVSVQVTVAVLMLIATGMLLENTRNRLNRRVLFDTSRLIAAQLELPDDYDEGRGQHFFAQVLARVRAVDGVTAAAIVDAIPGGKSPSPGYAPSSIVADAPSRGLSGTPTRINGSWVHVSPGLMDTLGMGTVRGRDFNDRDQAGSDPVVLVTESTALRLWPGVDPLGKRLTCCRATYMRRVVGVVPDPVGAVGRPLTMDLGEALSESGQFSDTGQGVFVFVPAAQHYDRTMLLVLRSDTPQAAIQSMRDAVVALDPGVPVFGASPVDATQFAQPSSDQAVRLLAGALGIVALGIAVFGVYAIVSYYVTRRRREFGLRLALGSSRGQIVKLVVDYAIHIVLIGLLPGVLIASLGTRYFQAELQNLQPNGVTVWVAVPILMLVVGVLAAYIPARRAARVDPFATLKEL